MVSESPLYGEFKCVALRHSRDIHFGTKLLSQKSCILIYDDFLSQKNFHRSFHNPLGAKNQQKCVKIDEFGDLEI